MSREAMQKALDALEMWCMSFSDMVEPQDDEAIAALRAALAETPKPDKTEQGRAASRILGENVSALVGGGVPFLNALDATLKTYDHPPAALAEPVAWEFTLDGCRQVMLDEDADEAIRHHGIPLYRHPPAAPTLVDGVDPARIKDFDVTAYGRDGDGFDRTP